MAPQRFDSPALTALVEYLDWVVPSENPIDTLVAASKTGDCSTLAALLDRGVQVDAATSAGWTGLRAAVFEGQLHAVRMLLDFGAVPDSEALYLGVVEAQHECVELLLRHGADPDALIPGTGKSSREFAKQYAESGEPKYNRIVIRLERGEETVVRSPDRSRPLALVKALAESSTAEEAYDQLLTLLSSSTTVIESYLIDEHGNGAVQLVAQNEHLSTDKLMVLLEILLSRGFDPNHINKLGKSALYMALMRRRFDMIRLLVEHGAELEQTHSNRNYTPLALTLLPSYLSGAHTTKEALDDTLFLLQLGASPNHPDADGNSPLHIACGCYQSNPPSSTVRSLSAPVRVHGSKFQVGVRQGWSSPARVTAASCALSSSGMSGSTSSPRFTVNKQDPSKAAPEQSLIADNTLQMQLVEELLKYGARIDNVNTAGATALVYAVDMGRIDIVELLCEEGASLSQVISPESGECVLHHAAANGLVPIIATLVRFMDGALVLDGTGRTALHAACAGEGNPEAVTMLASLIPCDVVDTSGMTALHLAAMNGHANAVAVLVQMGASIQATDSSKRSPLAVAAYCGKTSTVQTLLNLGAKVDVTDSRGQTALQHACLSAWDAVKVLPALLAQPDVNVNASEANSLTPLQLLVEQSLPKEARSERSSPVRVEAVAASTDLNKVEQAIQLLQDAGADWSVALEVALRETKSVGLRPDRIAILCALVQQLISRGASPNKLPALVRTCVGNSNFEPLADALLSAGGNPRLDGDLQHSVYLEISDLVLTGKLGMARAEELFMWLRSCGCKAAGTGNAFEHQAAAWFTALHRATMSLPGDELGDSQRSELVRLLVTKAYADVNAPDSTGKTPLQAAVQSGNMPAARTLLEFCANPNSVGGIRAAKSAASARSPIRASSPRASRIPSSPKSAGKGGKGMSARKDKHETGAAAYHTMARAVEEQAQQTVRENQIKLVGQPPLKIAILNDDPDMVKLLLEYRAAPEVQDEWGAISPRIFALLREHGGKVGKQETLATPDRDAPTSKRTPLSPFIDRISQMSHDRLLLESTPVGGSRLLESSLSPERAASAVVRQIELNQAADRIKNEQMALEQYDLKSAEREAAHIESNRAMSDVEKMIASRGRAVGTGAIKKSLHDYEEQGHQRKQEEATQQILQEAEAHAHEELTAKRGESWADKEIDALLERRHRVKTY